MRAFLHGILVLVLLSMLLSSTISAQQSISAASLGGIVTDASGAVIPGVSVVATNRSTNQTRVVSTDDEGKFLFSYLPVGDYSLKFETNGFERVERDLTLTVGQSLSIDVLMPVGKIIADIDEIVPSVIENARTQIAGTIKSEEVDDLPLNGRNFLDLALLLPGVSRTNTGNVQRFAETSAVPGTGISVAGQRNLNNSFIVDGSSANDDSVELTGTFYSQDVIREFQVVTNGAVAEYGRASSGFISIVTESGTNEFRGKAYGFLRNQGFDARNPIAKTRDPLTQTQYGATLGGPIRKDRTFFFSNFEQTRRNDSNVIAIQSSDVATINSRLDSVGFQGPRIETGLVPGGYDTTNFFGRVDHKLDEKNNLSVTYNFYDIDAINARTVGGLNSLSRGTNLENQDHTINTQLITLVGPSLLNELRVEVRRSRLGAPPIDIAGPAVNISGVASFGTATSSPTRRDIDLFQLSDSVTSIWKDHSFKAGGEVIYNDLNIEFPGALQGVYSFNNLNAFLNGNYSQFQQAFGATSQRQKNPNIGFFGQDEWRFSRNLTLNLGLRYDLQFLPGPLNTDNDNISPRLGFAYSPDEKTVVRGSFGMYYDRIPTRATSNALQRDGSKYIVAVFTPSTPGAPIFPNVLATQPSSLTIKPSITRIDPNIENSESTQASLQIDRALKWESKLSVGYMFLGARHLILSRNVNVPTCTDAMVNLCRPDPNFGNISRYEGSGNSTFNGLIVSFEKSSGRWLNTRLSYTLSKATDDAGNFFFSTPQNNFDRRAELGRSDNDQRHRLTFNGTLTPPHRSDGSFVSRLTNGFQLSWIYTYSSALPFNVILGADRNRDTNNNDRPDGVARNSGIGFDYSSLDLRLSRTFKFNEHMGLEFLVEGFNVFNRSNLSVPNNTFGQGATALPLFGTATAAYDPRQFQLGMRFLF